MLAEITVDVMVKPLHIHNVLLLELVMSFDRLYFSIIECYISLEIVYRAVMISLTQP